MQVLVSCHHAQRRKERDKSKLIRIFDQENSDSRSYETADLYTTSSLDISKRDRIFRTRNYLEDSERERETAEVELY